MAKINASKPKATFAKKMDKAVRSEGTMNFMGGLSFDIADPFLRLRCMAASCFMGEPTYYGEAKRSDAARFDGGKFEKDLGEVLFGPGNTGSAKSMIAATNECLAIDPEKTLVVALNLRNQDNIRLTPQVMLVLAANHPKVKGTGLVTKYGPEIMSRLDEVTTVLAAQMKMFGKPIPNSLKKALRARLERASDYQLAKYRMENNEVKLVDVANLVRPRSSMNSGIAALMEGKLKLGDGQETWESIRSRGGKWREAVEVMGHMALLRNLRNLFTSNEFNVGDVKEWMGKLEAGVPTGRQMPFRYWSAYREMKSACSGAGLREVLNGLESCIDASVRQFDLDGATAVFTDNSGSAHGAMTSKNGTVKVSEINNLFAAMLHKLTGGFIGVFGDRVQYVNSDLGVLKTAENVNQIGQGIGQSTETGLFLGLADMIENKTVVDRIVILSDMQAGTGGLYGDHHHLGKARANKIAMNLAWKNMDYGHVFYNVPALFNHYRKTVNPNAVMYCIQTAGYADTLFPTFCKSGIHILGGWSDNIIRYMERVESIMRNG